MFANAPVAVVETPEFLSARRKLMTEEERAALVDYLAYTPLAGDLIQGTGGVRKLRRRSRDLLLPQCRYSAVRAYGLRQEREGGSEPEGA